MCEKEITDLYKRIPSSICEPGCVNCCINTIQFSPSEGKRMGGYDWNGSCPHLVDGKCAVYENRPLVCRIYGTSETLPCSGCTPERVLSKEETADIIHLYTEYMKRETELSRE